MKANRNNVYKPMFGEKNKIAFDLYLTETHLIEAELLVQICSQTKVFINRCEAALNSEWSTVVDKAR